MSRMGIRWRLGLGWLLAWAILDANVRAQEPGSMTPRPSPGALEVPEFDRPAADAGTLGGPAGSGFPRVPASVTQPQPPPSGVSSINAAPPAVLPPSELASYGSLDLPEQPFDEGPPTGLTLDAAIERLVRENLDLRARFQEIPQAQADILTASLRANPILYADVQMVPYGSFAGDRNGGPTQYDVNVSIPIDISNKRGARMAVAGHARRVTEAQFQDAVRLTIDNLYTAYVDVLAARETIRFAKASVEGLDALIEPLRLRVEQELIASVEVDRVRIQRDLAEVVRRDAVETYRKAQHTLADLLNLPAGQAESLTLRGSLRVMEPQPPSVDVMIAMALQCRPDVVAYRLGIQRAHAEVKLAEVNKWADIYWLVQPYTFQDLRPFGGADPNAVSWATGVTVPLPLNNRNQGNIQRARYNVRQTQLELAAIERNVVTEVIQAMKDFEVTGEAVREVETDMLPVARKILETSRLTTKEGETDVVAFLSARRDFNDVVRQYRDFLIQHRRSMLKINTVVGRRLLP